MLSQDAGPSTIMAVDRSAPPQSALGRRLERACDMCRRKKVKCDGVRDSGSRCTNCIINSWDCTYVEISLRRAPPKSYVDGLESRVKQLTKLLSKISPETVKELDEEDGLGALTQSVTLQTTPSKPIHILESFYAKGRRANDVMPALLRHVTHLPASTPTESLEVFGEDLEEEEEESDEFVENTALSSVLESMSLRENHLRSSRHSSGVQYIETAYKLKQEVLHHKGVSVSELNRRHIDDDFPAFSNNIWASSETSQAFHGKLIYPPHDLMFSLIDLYFRHMNVFYPLLHRPTFERSVIEGVHLKNDLFAAILLLVCGIGARYSDDPRVVLDRADPRWESVNDMADGEFSYSRGWQWANQVPVIQRPPTEPPSLYELQFYVLWAEFLQGASAAQSCWPAIGFGIRIAQEVGVSRRKSHTLTLEDELWKRAFWVLVSLDRHYSSALGRPCALHDEDFDVELPIECDDEYLDHPDPKQRFKQPPSKPSLISYFNCYLRLNQILAFLLRTVYTINRSKILFGYVGQGEQKMIAELDSALNQWEESLPPHMVWDPNRPDETFFNQSATLHSAFQYVRILLHRPFIPLPRGNNQREYPSLTICTSAARSCANALDAQRRRVRFAPQPLQGMAFTSGVMLLMRIWSGKKVGLATDVEREMADVQKCLDSLKAAEVRHYSAGRQWDLLNVLSTMPELPIKREASDSPPYNPGVPKQHEASPQNNNPIDVGMGYDGPTQYGDLDFSVQIIYGDRVSPPADNSVVPQPTSNHQFQTSSGFWYDTARPYNNSQSGSPEVAAPQPGGSQGGYYGHSQEQPMPQEQRQPYQQQHSYIQPQVTGGAERNGPQPGGATGFSQPATQTINPYPSPPSNTSDSNVTRYPQTRISPPQTTTHSRTGSHHFTAPSTQSYPPPPPPAQAQHQQAQPTSNYAVSGGQPAYETNLSQGYNQYPSPPNSNPHNRGASYFPPAPVSNEGFSTSAKPTVHQHSRSFGQVASVSQSSGPINQYRGQNQSGYNYPSGSGDPGESYGRPRSDSTPVNVLPRSSYPSYEPAQAPSELTASAYAASAYGSGRYPAAPAGGTMQPPQAQSTTSVPANSQGYSTMAPAQQAPYYGSPQQQGPPQAPQQYSNNNPTYMQKGQPTGQMGYNYQTNDTSPAAMSQAQQPRSVTFQNMYAMWSAAPAGFRADEWGQYLSDMGGISTGKDVNPANRTPMQNYTWQYQQT